MRNRKNVFLLAICAVLLAGCRKSNEDAAREFGLEKTDYFGDDEDYIGMVKDGHPVKIPSISYGEAFEDFFADPEWKYFTGEGGENIVEFTGECQYRDADVKARLQFILAVEEGSFEYGALNFNEVPQTNLVTSLMIYKAFEEYADANNISIDDSDETDFSVGTETYFGDEDEETEQNDEEEYDDTGDGEEEEYDSADNGEEEESSDDAEDGGEEESDSADDGGENDTGSVEQNDEEEEEYASGDEEYICPHSDTVKLTKKEVKALSKKERRLARNEVYARHGRKFSDPSLQKYFDSKAWYEPVYEPEEFSDSLLNKAEKYNVRLIKKYE